MDYPPIGECPPIPVWVIQQLHDRRNSLRGKIADLVWKQMAEPAFEGHKS